MHVENFDKILASITAGVADTNVLSVNDEQTTDRRSDSERVRNPADTGAKNTKHEVEPKPCHLCFRNNETTR